jgi:hypothetical protein
MANQLEGFVFVTGCELENSPKYGGEIYRITFQDVGTEENYYTYADPKNRNFKRWADIIKFAKHAGIILCDVKIKDPKKGLINADSNFEVEFMETHELADIVVQARKRIGPQWGKWFE